jgi:hypothetical protein
LANNAHEPIGSVFRDYLTLLAYRFIVSTGLLRMRGCPSQTYASARPAGACRSCVSGTPDGGLLRACHSDETLRVGYLLEMNGGLMFEPLVYLALLASCFTTLSACFACANSSGKPGVCDAGCALRSGRGGTQPLAMAASRLSFISVNILCVYGYTQSDAI